MTEPAKAKEPIEKKHKDYGCDCTVCREWRRGIYESGRWPRPRYYNGERVTNRRGHMTDPDALHADPFLADCVICGRRAVELCVWREGQRVGGTTKDFCAECIESGADDDNFGRCYVCRDFHDHEHCIGVPCQCPCPTPDQRRREELRASAFEKLTPDERHAIGIS